MTNNELNAICCIGKLFMRRAFNRLPAIRLGRETEQPKAYAASSHEELEMHLCEDGISVCCLLPDDAGGWMAGSFKLDAPIAVSTTEWELRRMLGLDEDAQ
jgi:hypothetical protein